MGIAPFSKISEISRFTSIIFVLLNWLFLDTYLFCCAVVNIWTFYTCTTVQMLGSFVRIFHNSKKHFMKFAKEIYVMVFHTNNFLHFFFTLFRLLQGEIYWVFFLFEEGTWLACLYLLKESLSCPAILMKQFTKRALMPVLKSPLFLFRFFNLCI